MPVLVICKNEADPINAEAPDDILPILRKHSRAGNSKRNDPILLIIELHHDFLPLLVTCKIKVNLKKIEVAVVMTTFSPC